MARGLRIQPYGIPDVQERPVQGPDLPTQQPLSAFGGGEAADNAMGQATALAGDVQQRAEATYRDEYKNAVQLQGLELANQLTQEETRAKNALSQVKGKDALEARGKTLQDYDKFYTSLTKDIQNKDVRQLAQEHYSQRRNTLDAWATPYANGQVEEYDNNELLSSIKNEADSAAVDPSPANVAVSVMSQKLALAEFGQRNGRGPDWIKAKQLEASSSTHLEALKSIVNANQDIAAKEFFERNKDEFVGNDLIQAQRMVGNSSSIGAAQRITMDLFSRARDFSETGPVYATEKELQDSIDAATKNADPVVKQRVESMAFRQYSIEKTAKKEAQDSVYQTLAADLRKTGNLEAIQNTPSYELLDENDKRQLELTASRVAKGETPYAKVSDPKTVTKFDSMSREDLAAMSEADLLRRVPYVTEQQYEKMSTAWKGARNKEDLAEYKITEQDNKAIFLAVRNSPAIDGMEKIKSEQDLLKSSHSSTNAAFVDFKKEIQDKLEAAAAEKPMKRLSQKERDIIINDAVIDRAVKKPQSFMESTGDTLRKYGGYTAATGLGAVGGASLYGLGRLMGSSPPPISDTQREQITRIIVKSGGQPTDEKVNRMGRALLMKASASELTKLAGE